MIIRRVVLAVAVMAFAFGSGASLAAPAPRERARLIMLDQCVESSSNRGNLFEEIAKNCRCASGRTAKKLSDDEVAAVVSADKLTGSATRVWNEQMKACK
ncbi:MAG: hypothetical protein KDJ62_02530 [Rhodobiaceae bacterium]|nr:hypothetical protein [Rhodobiaceae bacterium]